MGMSKMTADVDRVSCWSNGLRRCVHPSVVTRTTFCIDCNTFLFIEPGSIYQGPVAVSPRMGESPDLAALEARLKFGDSLDAAECGSLIAALRATRAALHRYVTASAPSSLLVDQGIAALASCTDHEGAPAAQE